MTSEAEKGHGENDAPDPGNSVDEEEIDRRICNLHEKLGDELEEDFVKLSSNAFLKEAIETPAGCPLACPRMAFLTLSDSWNFFLDPGQVHVQD